MSSHGVGSPQDYFVPVTQTSSRTRIKVWKCCYRWEIENFSHCPRSTGQYLESPSFSVGPRNEQKWRLELYPKGVSEEFQDYVAVYLKLVCSNESKTHANFEVSLLNQDGKKLRTLFGSGVFSPFSRTGWKDFLKKDMLFKTSLEYLKVNNISLHCELNSSIETRSSTSADEIRVSIPRFSLPEKLLGLLQTGKLSDVVISTGKKKFHAHATVLAASSPKFLSMFSRREGNEVHHVNMKGYDAEVVAEILEYLYAGLVPNFSGQLAEQLLSAAEEFDLHELKSMAEEVFMCRVTVETAADILLLAYQHNAKRLKKFCLDFVRRNVAAVLDTETWKMAAQEMPRMVEDVTTTLALCLAHP